MQGDVILAFNGTPVSGIDDLHRLLGEDHIRSASNLSVLRGVDQFEVRIVPEEAVS